ncbi:hypothetical protein Scep_024581 [Stephania cephalantha]|uniref:Uncharacterized protein n=1 Tax=Stephania cephalantha TaxID=152367 RepID=A0AAP0EWT4_9MAGN
MKLSLSLLVMRYTRSKHKNDEPIVASPALPPAAHRRRQNCRPSRRAAADLQAVSPRCVASPRSRAIAADPTRCRVGVAACSPALLPEPSCVCWPSSCYRSLPARSAAAQRRCCRHTRSQPLPGAIVAAAVRSVAAVAVRGLDAAACRDLAASLHCRPAAACLQQLASTATATARRPDLPLRCRPWRNRRRPLPLSSSISFFHSFSSRSLFFSF